MSVFIRALHPKYASESIQKLKYHEQPIIHSEQNGQYQMRGYQQALKQRGITQNMSEKVNYLDNVIKEIFFCVLKSEFFYTKKFTDADVLIAELKDYIWYYNHERIKTKLKGLSPEQYRNQSLFLNQAKCPTFWSQIN